MLIKIQPTTLLQIFWELMINFKIISKSIKVADDISGYAWVNLTINRDYAAFNVTSLSSLISRNLGLPSEWQSASNNISYHISDGMLPR